MVYLLFEEDPCGDERPGEGEGLRQEVEAARGVDQVELPRPRPRPGRGLHQAEAGEAGEAGVAEEELRGESIWRRRKRINNGGGLYCCIVVIIQMNEAANAPMCLLYKMKHD